MQPLLWGGGLEFTGLYLSPGAPLEFPPSYLLPLLGHPYSPTEAPAREAGQEGLSPQRAWQLAPSRGGEGRAG